MGSGCELNKAILFNVDLRGADLAHAKLNGDCVFDADLRGAHSFSADFCEAYLSGAKMSQDTDLGEAIWDTGCVSILERSARYQEAQSSYRALKN